MLLPMCDRSEAAVELDLAAVRFIDSTGIALLLRAHRRADAAGGTLRIVQPMGQVARVLAATGADEILQIVPASPSGA